METPRRLAAGVAEDSVVHLADAKPDLRLQAEADA
jgi:hypothetical protein